MDQCHRGVHTALLAAGEPGRGAVHQPGEREGFGDLLGAPPGLLAAQAGQFGEELQVLTYRQGR
ncbi:hypothetical protein GCM10023238_22380 [Streptomyces heliomycini]